MITLMQFESNPRVCTDLVEGNEIIETWSHMYSTIWEVYSSVNMDMLTRLSHEGLGVAEKGFNPDENLVLSHA